jgi:fucose 4-O-acetylase-like acetyltransferase
MKRIAWVDAARGFAIILVVFGHVLGGVMSRRWLDGEGLYRAIYNYIYLFHMPLFFMISGLFCIEAMRKSPINAFISRTESIASPYIFWDFFVRTAALPLIGAFMSNPPSDIGWHARLEQALTGEVSWFLWTLYVMQILLIPFARMPIWVLFLVSLAVSLYLPNSHLGTINSVVDHLPFLLFGAMLQPFLSRLKSANHWRPLLLALGAFLFVGIALLLGWTEHKTVWFLCGIAGSLASVFLVQYLGETIELKLLANLGIASLAIYVLHPYFQGLARELLLRIFGASPVWQLIIPTIIAIVGPYIVWRVSQHNGLFWLFRLRLPNIMIHSGPNIK